MLYNEISLTNISVNITLNTLLENCSDMRLQQLKESTYNDRVIFFEEYIYHPIAVLLADKYTLLNDYPDIIGELFPCSLKDLHNITINDTKNNGEFKFPTDMMDILRSKDYSLLSKLLYTCVKEKVFLCKIKYIMVIIIALSWYVSLHKNTRIKTLTEEKIINNIKCKLMIEKLNCFPFFRTKVLNILNNISKYY